MLIIINSDLPRQAVSKLEKYGEVLLFETKGIVYDSISKHPDIFFSQLNGKLIVAPDLPGSYKDLLAKRNIAFIEGEEKLGQKYPQTARYNIVATENYLMHNFRYTDSAIINHQEDLDLIHLNQGYARCNLLPLKDDHFITSDEGIKRTLNNFKLNVLYVDPKGILLKGQKNGFFGGTCGIFKENIFFTGSLSNFVEGKKVHDYLEKLDYSVIELHNGPLYDGGSIFFLDP